MSFTKFFYLFRMRTVKRRNRRGKRFLHNDENFVTSCKKYFLYGVADYVRDLLERLSDADALSSHTSDYIGSVILDKEQFV